MKKKIKGKAAPKRKSVKKHVFVRPRIIPDGSTVLKKFYSWWKNL